MPVFRPSNNAHEVGHKLGFVCYAESICSLDSGLRRNDNLMNYRVKVSFSLSPIKPFVFQPAPVSRSEFVYCDDALLVVNKPAGLLSVPGRGPDKQDCLSVRVQQEFPDALVVHRLDMATSGLLVFALSKEMQRRLSAMFSERLITKRYIAIVAGKLAPVTGEVNLPILADWENRPRRKIDVESGQPSLTRYAELEYDALSDASRVALEPLTGRTHQLRVHMNAIGHPIVGDNLYDGRAAERLMLHAQMLSFTHPLSGEAMHFACEPPFLNI